MIPLPVFSWKLIAGMAAALIVSAVLWWAQARIRVSYQAEEQRDAAIAQHAAYKAAVEQSAAKWAEKFERDSRADAELALKIQSLDADRARLAAAASAQKPITEKTDAHGTTRISISPAWWMCVSAFVSRDAADTAACEANPSPSGVPDTISR